MKMMISRTQVFTVNPETQIKTNKQRQTHCWSSVTDFRGIFGSSTGDRTPTHDVTAAGINGGAESQFWEAVAFISMLTQRSGFFSVYVFGHTLVSWHQRGDEFCLKSNWTYPQTKNEHVVGFCWSTDRPEPNWSRLFHCWGEFLLFFM